MSEPQWNRLPMMLRLSVLDWFQVDDPHLLPVQQWKGCSWRKLPHALRNTLHFVQVN